LTIGYNGQSRSHLLTELNIVQPQTPHPTIRWQDRRIRPRFTNVLLQNILNSNYNSLTVKVEKRYSRGLTLLSSFTWSHAIEYADEALFEGGSGRASPYELWRDPGSSSLARRVAWVTSFVWELPAGRGRRWARTGPASRLLGGWDSRCGPDYAADQPRRIQFGLKLVFSEMAAWLEHGQLRSTLCLVPGQIGGLYAAIPGSRNVWSFYRLGREQDGGTRN